MGDESAKYYSTPAVADLFDVTVGTVRDWIRNGELLAVKFGRRWKVSETELHRFANERLKGKW